MVKHAPGTALLIVLFIAASMAAVGLLSFKSSLWGDSLDQAIYQKEKQYQFAQGLLDCGIARAKRDFDIICKNKNNINGQLQYEQMSGAVLINPKGNVITVASTVTIGSQAAYTISAELVKDEHLLVSVRCFQR